MSKRIDDLRKENVQIHARMKELADREPEEWGAESEEEFERLSEQFDKNETTLRRLEKIDEVGGVLETTVAASVGQRQREQPTAAIPGTEKSEPTKDERSQMYAEAFDSYLRGGMTNLTPEHRQVLRGGFAYDVGGEQRAQSLTNAEGGFAVPDAQMAALEESMLAFGGLRRGPITVLRTSGGNPLPIPTATDTANAGTILNENTQASDVDATFGQVVLGAFKYTSGIIKVSMELMQDASFNVADWAVRAVGTRIARGLAPQLIVGDGTTEPGGLDLAASFETATGASALTRDDILDLIHSIDPAYRSSPAFRLVLGDGALLAIKKLAVGTADDRPLWVPSMRDGAPASIEGVPYVVDQGVADVGAGNRSMYAGDLSKFWLREAGGVRIRRLDERYADFDQVAFVGFARYDSDIIDAGTDPIKYLRHPAS